MKPVLDPAVPIVVPVSRKYKLNWYAISPSILQWLVWFPLRPLFKFFIRFRIEGIEHIKNLQKGVIFAANHSSEFDPILIPSAMPFLSRHIPFFYLSRDSDAYKHLGWYARLLYGGFFFKIWGAYPVKSGTHSYEKALGEHATFISEGHSVCIFPEAGMQRNGVLAKGHGGVSYLAWETGKPIVPVGINGAANMGILEMLSRRRQVTIRFGEPLYQSELFERFGGHPTVNETKNDFTVSAELVMSRIAHLLEG